MPASRFRVDWVLVQELAIGPAPRAERHLERLAAEGVRGVLSLSGEEEALPPSGLEQRFACRRVVLPDHRVGRMPLAEELAQALAALAQLREEGPVFVHCVAAMERSPLVCLAWLVRQRGLSPQRALDYMMQVHPGTSPLPGQLELLEIIASPSTHVSCGFFT
jgi:hypothetical protein